jgi:hypothetical protein
MAKYKIPRSHRTYDERATAFAEGFTKARRERISLAASTPLGEYLDKNFLPKIEEVRRLFPAWDDPMTRTPVVGMQLHQAEAELLPYYVEAMELFMANPLVTNEDLLVLGFPQRSSRERRATSAAMQYPWYRSSTPRISCIEIEFGNIETGRKTKPRGQRGVECRWVIRDTPPTSTEELLYSTSNTSTPLLLEFPRADRGKTVYFALRWEDARARKGPFGPIESAVIP